MRLSRPRINALSSRLAETLLNQNLIETAQKKEGIASKITAVILKELEIETRLNREVEEIMQRYDREMQSGEIDSHAMFLMIKKQLVRERNLIL